MLGSVTVVFITTSYRKVWKLLRKHFTNSSRFEQIIKGGEVKKADDNHLSFSVNSGEGEEFKDFIDCLDSHGEIEIVDFKDGTGSAPGYWYKVKIN